MCLRTSRTKPFIAKTNIIVYKLFTINSNGQLVTPYRKFKWLVDELEIKRLRLDGDYSHGYSVSTGLHSFRTLGTIIKARLVDYNRRFLYGRRYANKAAIIVECVIPKGYQYFIGYNNDIISNKLRIKKMVI